jgi:uncharacterized protein YabE (DUF348 family)
MRSRLLHCVRFAGRHAAQQDPEVATLDEKRVPFYRGALNLGVALGGALLRPGSWVCLALIAAGVRATVAYTQQLAPVTVIVDGVPRHVRTRCASVGELLDDMGVDVGEQDQLVPGRDTPVQARMTIDVRYARPVTVVADGATETVYTHSDAVSDILDEAGITLTQGDRLSLDGRWLADPQDGGMASASLPPLVPVQGRALALQALSSRGGRSSLVPAAPARIEVQRARVVHLDDGGLEQTLRTTANTVGEVLVQAQTVVHVGDRVYPGFDAPVTAGLRIRVQRGTPVAVVLDGHTLRTRTHSHSVGQVLAELGVSLVGEDFVQPPLEAEVQEGVRIQVVRVARETVIEQEEVPFETEWIPDPSMEIDHRRVEDVGASGLIRRRYSVAYHDGNEVDRTLQEQWLAREPRSFKVAYGTQIVVRTLQTPDGPVEYWRRIRVFLTSYTANTCGKAPGDPGYGITRLGWKMRHGIIAVDPTVIRLRSSLYVPGYGQGIAGDTGGLIKGRHIDLGYEVYDSVWHYEWGYVYVLTPVPPAAQIHWILPDYPQER